MSSLLTHGLRESIRNGWPRAFFVFVNHPQGAVWVWSGSREFRTSPGVTGDPDFDGQKFTAIGPPVGGISGMGGSKQFRLRVTTLSLSGLPDDAEALMNADINGARAKVWEAGLNDRGDRINGLPYLWQAGKCDYDEWSAAADGKVELRVHVVSPIVELEAPANPTYNPEWLNRMFGDGENRLKGLDRLHEVPTADVTWSQW